MQIKGETMIVPEDEDFEYEENYEEYWEDYYEDDFWEYED